MILRAEHRILVIGMTGRQGRFWTRAMIDYGARVVGGVNPRKAGQRHLERPVFASAGEATEFDVALMFVPPLAAGAACIEACEAGARTIICLAEHIPARDVVDMIAAARHSGTRLFGPNTSGLVTPGESFAGIMPAFNDNLFRPGRIGVISRSGSLGALVCLNLTRAGFGQSAFLGVGGDPIIGTDSREALELFDHDERTDAVVICGEIGGCAEEEAAAYAADMNKPVIAFIAGRQAPQDRQMGHAGAIVSGNRGGYADKRRAFEHAGVAVADLPSELPTLLSSALG